MTEVNPDFAELPKSNILDDSFNYMLEEYMDSCITLDIPRIKDKLNHVANVIMTEIQYMFPPNKYDKEDVISLKKILNKEDAWTIIRNVMGF